MNRESYLIAIAAEADYTKIYPARKQHEHLSISNIIHHLLATDKRLSRKISGEKKVSSHLTISNSNRPNIDKNGTLHPSIEARTEARIEARIEGTPTLQYLKYFERSDLIIFKLSLFRGYYVMNLKSLGWSYYTKKRSANATERLVYKHLASSELEPEYLKKLSYLITEPEHLKRVHQLLSPIKRFNESDKKVQRVR